LFWQALPVRAGCLVCDDVVEPDEDEATCFLTELNPSMTISVMRRMAGPPHRWLPAPPSGAFAGGQWIPCLRQGRRLPPDRETTLVLDAAGALYLYDLIDATLRPIDPVVVPDLFRQCGGSP